MDGHLEVSRLESRKRIFGEVSDTEYLTHLTALLSHWHRNIDIPCSFAPMSQTLLFL